MESVQRHLQTPAAPLHDAAVLALDALGAEGRWSAQVEARVAAALCAAFEEGTELSCARDVLAVAGSLTRRPSTREVGRALARVVSRCLPEALSELAARGTQRRRTFVEPAARCAPRIDAAPARESVRLRDLVPPPRILR